MPAPVADVPTAGAGRYFGSGWATEQDGDLRETLPTTFTAGVDFGNQNMRASIGILRRNGDHLVLNSDTIDIADARFAGSLGGQEAGAGYSGTIEGGFFGPRAVEIGGAFEADGPTRIRGAFVGTRDFDRLID